MKISLCLMISFFLVIGCKLNLSNDVIIVKPAMQKFSHQNLTSSCQTCHQQEMPETKHVNNQECSLCHTTSSWKTTNIIHTENMQNCTDCHESQIPYFKHGGDQKCSSCHQTSSWSETNFIHNKAENDCQQCHISQKPAVEKFPIPDYEVNDGHYDQKDCSKCHLVSTWEFDHSNAQEEDIKFCLPCHYQRGIKAVRPRPNWHAKKTEWFKDDGYCYPCHAEKRSWKRVMAKP